MERRLKAKILAKLSPEKQARRSLVRPTGRKLRRCEMNLVRKGSVFHVHVTVAVDWRFVAVLGILILAWLLIR